MYCTAAALAYRLWRADRTNAVPMTSLTPPEEEVQPDLHNVTVRAIHHNDGGVDTAEQTRQACHAYIMV